MPLWQWILDVAGISLLALVLLGASFAIRRRILCRNGGTFELSCRLRAHESGRGWVLGLGRYSGERLEWFRLFSLRFTPRETWERTSLSYDGQRRPMDVERASLYPDHLVITCTGSEGEVELAMSAASLTGLQSWLEAQPPGTDWDKSVRRQ